MGMLVRPMISPSFPLPCLGPPLPWPLTLFDSGRILANAGYPVLELRRERYGKIILGNLAEGGHEPVSGKALEWAGSLLGGDSDGEGGGRGGRGGAD